MRASASKEEENVRRAGRSGERGRGRERRGDAVPPHLWMLPPPWGTRPEPSSRSHHRHFPSSCDRGQATEHGVITKYSCVVVVCRKRNVLCRNSGLIVCVERFECLCRERSDLCQNSGLIGCVVCASEPNLTQLGIVIFRKPLEDNQRTTEA